jgi:CRP-like cAMP-binding protein
MYIVLAGRVEVVTMLKSGRMDVISTLGPGEIFGETALIHNAPRSRSVQSTRATLLLSIDSDAFHEILLRHMDAKSVEDIVQKRAFLNRISLCRTWEPKTVDRFSVLSVLSKFRPRERAIDDGNFNQFFYIVYEGNFGVEKKGNAIARLGWGDFFGEISLLEFSVASADVVAQTPAKCLAIHHKLFLQFLGEDYKVALLFERMSSKRLKHPVFPLRKGTFDAGIYSGSASGG